MLSHSFMNTKFTCMVISYWCSLPSIQKFYVAKLDFYMWCSYRWNALHHSFIGLSFGLYVDRWIWCPPECSSLVSLDLCPFSLHIWLYLSWIMLIHVTWTLAPGIYSNALRWWLAEYHLSWSWNSFRKAAKCLFFLIQ